MINVNGQISFMPEISFIFGYFPYIIYYYSITNIPTLIIIELPYRRRISRAMLIGICCGCASIFFFTLALIIMIYRKLKKNNPYGDGDLFSEEEEGNQFISKDFKYQDKNTISPKTESDLDLDFWL